jgi:hypothetical protein
MADNSKNLTKGETRIPAKDDTAITVTVSATDGTVTSESPVMQRASAACPQQNYGQPDPPPGTDTKEHYRFFQDRVDVDNPAPPLAYRGDSQTESFTQLYDPALDVTFYSV